MTGCWGVARAERIRPKRPSNDSEDPASYVITLNGAPFLTATPGGTGACWNIGEFENGEPCDEIPLHVILSASVRSGRLTVAELIQGPERQRAPVPE